MTAMATSASSSFGTVGFVNFILKQAIAFFLLYFHICLPLVFRVGTIKLGLYNRIGIHLLSITMFRTCAVFKMQMLIFSGQIISIACRTALTQHGSFLHRFTISYRNRTQMRIKRIVGLFWPFMGNQYTMSKVRMVLHHETTPFPTE